MTKDPAALFYIDTWLSSTAEMDSDVRGWYLNLILHQYDKKDLPNDVEKLAVMAGVKFSEFERFKQVLEQVLKHKFKQNESGRLENDKAKEILRAREIFKDKRTKSGTIGAVIKLAKSVNGFTDSHLRKLKTELYSMELEAISKHMDKQVLKQMLKLYINGNVNEDINTNTIEDRDNVFKAELSKFFDTYGKDMCREFYNYWSERNQQGTKMKFEMQKTWELGKRLKTWANNKKQFKGKHDGKSANEESRERLLRESLDILNS